MASLLTVVLMTLGASGCADVAIAPQAGEQSQLAPLDVLFQRLRATDNEAEAKWIEATIQRTWAKSGDPNVDTVMALGVLLARGGNLDAALAAMNKAVQMAPSFAEAYDQRAIIQARRQNYGAAVVDWRRALAREPRHYAALVGLGRLYLLYGRDQAALGFFDDALAINPHLDAVRVNAEHLRARLFGIPA